MPTHTRAKAAGPYFEHASQRLVGVQVGPGVEDVGGAEAAAGVEEDVGGGGDDLVGVQGGDRLVVEAQPCG